MHDLQRVVLGAGLAALLACSSGEDVPAPQARADLPDIFLLSLDTVRADALGVYRPEAASVTPSLDAFAADAVVFERAVAPMPFTLPSHMSMLTGLHPVEHGVSTEKHRLAPGIETMTQWLKRAGYRTVGRVTNEWLKGDFGFGRGFDSYRRLRHGLTYAERVNEAGLAAVDQGLATDRPLFLFLHYMDAHSDFSNVRGNLLPYYAPESRLGELVSGPRDERFCDPQQRCATAYLLAADRERREVSSDRLAELRALYEAGIAELDARLGELFAALRERGVYDDALIIVTSDHGEEFREHGRLLHSQTYEESVRVPLMIKLPGNRRGGERVRRLASVIDLPPTLLAYLGMSGSPQIDGPVDLLAEPAEQPARKRALAQDKLKRSLWSLTQGRFKLIRDLGGEDGGEELYDLRRDPGETRNLAAEQPRVVEGLSRRLDRELRDLRRHGRRLAAIAPDQAPPNDDTGDGGSLLTDKERERLKALGYL